MDMRPFDAAHQLPYHHGKCQNLHGHTYNVQIEVSGTIRATFSRDSDSGMVVDFGVVKDLYQRLIHDVVDHSYMTGIVQPEWFTALESIRYTDEPDRPAPQVGKVARLPIDVTTAENLAVWMFRVLSGPLDKEFVHLESVSVFETATASAKAVRYDRS